MVTMAQSAIKNERFLISTRQNNVYACQVS